MIGQTLGKYRVQDRIGRGGMGTVYLAVDETLRREVAIKVLNSELNDPEIARRFRAEAVTVARLNHPGIATVYELFEHDSQWLMVMEFVRGETLEHMVERTGALPVDRAADLCIQALTALAHAHSMGVVHRDLKPANLMVTESGVVKVMDFGIARVAGSEHLTTAGFMMGTPAYMSPEQVLGHEIDARADLYAMGVVLYRLCTSKLPFKGDSPFAMAQSQVNDPPTPVGLMRAGMPPWVELVIGRALSKAPEDRFQTADEFRETIKRGVAGLPIDVAPNAFVPPELLLTAPPGTMPALTPTGQTGQTASPPSGAMPTVASRPITQPVADPDMTVMAGRTPLPGPGTGQLGPSSGRTAQTGAPTGQTVAGPGTGQTALSTGPVAAASTGQMAAAGTAPIASPTGATAQTPLATGPVAQTTKVPGKKSATPMVGIAAGVVIVAALAFWFWYRAHTAALAEQALAAAAAQAAADTAAAAAAAPPVQLETPPPVAPPPVVPAPAPPPATVTATEPPPGTTPSGARGEPGTTPAGAAGATSATTQAGATGAAGARGARGAVPEVSDSHVAFGDAKILVLNGKKAQEQDVIVNFVAGQISVAPKKGGVAVWTVGYKILAHATYLHAKDPKWDTSLPSPPDGLDIPGFMRGARHWLVLQARVENPGYVILHLDDSNWSELLDTLETRTGIKVERLSAGGK